jgi:bifunctional non-homologous end joining protein LigD
VSSVRRYGKRSFETSKEDKVLFPDSGITKGDLIDYYERVSGVMLPHVRGRIVAMRRHPDGIGAKSFFQKAVPDYFPTWIETVEVDKEGGKLRQLTIERTATLAYLANQACIAIHVWPSRADDPRRPDRLIFDLDPSTDDFGPVRDAARAVRDVLERLELAAGVMTTGSRGLHVVSPLDRTVDFDRARTFASGIARFVASQDPDRFTVAQRKTDRGDRVFVDYLRNAYGQHGVAPYSVRARPGAPVATPIDWRELADSSLGPRKYTVRNLFRRLSRKEDPWRGLARHAAALDDERYGRLERMLDEEDDRHVRRA